MGEVIKITTSDELNKIFENSNNNLVVLMFYTRHNSNCKRSLQYYQNTAANHTTSILCVVDTDNFKGDSRFIKKIDTMPKFDYYYMGNSIGSHTSCGENDIEEGVRSAERYVMTQNNSLNNNHNNQTNQFPVNNLSSANTSVIQIQQNILSQAMATNPSYYQYLMNNPHVLQQMIQQQMNQMGNNMSHMMPGTMPVNAMPSNAMPASIPNNAMPNNAMPTGNPPMANQMLNQNATDDTLPSFQQMQRMFHIFQMMHQMGVLNMNVPVNDPKPMEDDNAILLPNGDRVIPLANGKYGLIKKN